ncbi:hypothetical protein GF386_06080 [Candidatus Pacearchaeota archaeon]|nr:hypothetical protein [Candidatus Pacearchaeota archaeon]MBD3283658.1 hypothetical protein [Candidatus Pacearchaeota archaeon]
MRSYFLKKEAAVALLILFLVFLVNAYSNKTLETGVNIPDNPPYFYGPIPNFSWPINNNITDAFDLDDYFIDDSGFPLSFNYTPVENVTVVIDAYNNVSFYPDYDFMGARNLTFTATDNMNQSTDSNQVFLFIGVDDQAPQWSNPRNITNRSGNQVYYGDYVNFSVDWTDNLQLKSYQFQIDMGSGWVYYAWQSFTGFSNSSFRRVRVTASAGTDVHWRFCSNDTTNNQNCSETMSFTVQSEPEPPEPPEPPPGPGGGGGGGGTGTGGVVIGYVPEVFLRRDIKNFSVDPEFFKISLKQGGRETRILKIQNIGNYDLELNLFIKDLENFIELSKTHFNLSSGETQKITVDFFAGRNTTPEEYF